MGLNQYKQWEKGVLQRVSEKEAIGSDSVFVIGHQQGNINLTAIGNYLMNKMGKVTSTNVLGTSQAGQ